MVRDSRLIRRLSRAACTLGLVAASTLASAESATIAVASSLLPWLQEQQARFAETSPHNVILAAGSTGKHDAQIRYGAPFDALIAADALRPVKLHQDGFGTGHPPLTVALGQLALWSPTAAKLGRDTLLSSDSRARLAIANPALAPYGAAAQQTLTGLGSWTYWQPLLVRGENVAQAMQFVATGHARWGLIALSLLQRPGHHLVGNYWLIPADWHEPIRHDALLLRDNPTALAFLNHLMQPPAQRSLTAFGLQSGRSDPPNDG